MSQWNEFIPVFSRPQENKYFSWVHFDAKLHWYNQVIVENFSRDNYVSPLNSKKVNKQIVLVSLLKQYL